MAECQNDGVNTGYQALDSGTKTHGRRAVLAGLATAPLAGAIVAATVAPALARDHETDAVLAAWRKWRQLEEEERRLAAEIERLYVQLPKVVQMPGVEVCEKFCMDDDGIDAACAAAPAWMHRAIPGIRDCAKKELMAVNARSEQFRDEIGLTKLEDRQDEIIGSQVSPIKVVENAAGATPVVLAAKLDIAVSCFRGNELLEDCPLWYIRCAMRGLLPQLPPDMAKAMQPIADRAETAGDVYWPKPTEASAPQVQS